MPYIPHTEHDIQTMLETIGVTGIQELFDEIPKALRIESLEGIPEGLGEMDVSRLMLEKAAQDRRGLCFIGAGAYEHHIPAAVWDIASRGEFMTAYTPYQAEASQGTLQLLYEYQTMMAHLLSMDVSNASLYDGASALAEAVLMAVRANRHSHSKRILVLGSLHPHYLQTVQSIVRAQQIEIEVIPFSAQQGTVDIATLAAYDQQDITALVIPQPNFFGGLEAVDALTQWAHAHKALTIAVVNPIAMAVLKEPGQWGDSGADIACGEGQPLGIPLSSGGPYFGFITCKQEYVRQMPGRIIGCTVDSDGKRGFSLTLQAREQHIRRSKATSNICTNQGLAVTAATIFMSLLGFDGLKKIAENCYANTHRLTSLLTQIPGVERLFAGPYFHEVALRLPCKVEPVLQRLLTADIQGGIDISPYYDSLKQENALLVCATETKTDADLVYFAEQLKRALHSTV